MKKVDYRNCVAEKIKNHLSNAELKCPPGYTYAWGNVYIQGIYQENEVLRMSDMGWIPVPFMDHISDFIEEYDTYEDYDNGDEQLKGWILPDYIDYKGMRLYKRPYQFGKIEELCMHYPTNVNIDNYLYKNSSNVYETISIELFLLNILKHRRLRRKTEIELEDPQLYADLDDALSYLTGRYFGQNPELVEKEDEGINDNL